VSKFIDVSKLEAQTWENACEFMSDRVKELEAVVSSQTNEIKELKEKVLEAIDCENGCKICILIKEEVEKAVKNGK